MGMSARVSLVVGVRYSDVVKIKKTEEVETRYDEKTGKPYEKKIVKSQMFFGNVLVNEDDHDGLEVFNPAYNDSDKSDSIIGVEVCRTKDLCSGASTVLVDKNKIVEAVAKIVEVLKKSGVENLIPRLWLVPRVS